MPTITVDLSADDPALRKAFTKNLSLWLRTQGVDINHVITRFTQLRDHDVFSGPFPLTTGFAFVRLTVDRARTAAFRRELAERVVRELGPRIAPERVFVQFDPVDPGLHFTGASLAEGAPHE
ncbi:hypothetical protein ACFYXF_31400 [Streptomyces sp. NPDC002680]|uniref:hypothetical protein n=1 Tax=Streptomyces sp. NPDC002680 TaxID=3364659 RepID=UPI0036B81DBB